MTPIARLEEIEGQLADLIDRAEDTPDGDLERARWHVMAALAALDYSNQDPEVQP